MNNNEEGKILLVYMKAYSLAILFITVWYWQIYRHTNQWSRTENPEIDANMPNWFLAKTQKQLSSGKIAFPISGSGKTGHPCCCCSVIKSCLNLCDPTYHSTTGFPVLHHLQELAQTHVHCVSDAIQPSYPLSSPSPPAFNPSQHQCLFQWASYLHQVAKGLEFQLQHQSFQWVFRTDFL